MHIRSKQGLRKWLSLLFVASLLVNAQASIACAMMPDMSDQHAECCCGVTHRPVIQIDIENDQSSSGQFNSQANDQGQGCDDPRIGCCMLEVSVGMNDPPTSDEALTLSSKTLSSKNVEHQQIFKLLDHTERIEFNGVLMPLLD